MKIPDWAPPDLVDVWNRRDEPVAVPPKEKGSFEVELVVPIINGNIRDESIALLWRFITDSRMKGVWEDLMNRDAARVEDRKRTGVMWFFLAQAGISGWSAKSKFTGAQKRSHLLSIQKAAMRLASMLNGSPYLKSTSVERLLNDDEVLQFGRNYPISDIGDKEKFVGWQRCEPFEYLPPMEILIGRLVELADAYKKQREIVRQPKSNNAHIHFFVRTLSSHLRRFYGQPLHGILATMTSVALGVELDEEAARLMTLGITAESDTDSVVEMEYTFGCPPKSQN